MLNVDQDFFVKVYTVTSCLQGLVRFRKQTTETHANTASKVLITGAKS